MTWITDAVINYKVNNPNKNQEYFKYVSIDDYQKIYLNLRTHNFEYISSLICRAYECKSCHIKMFIYKGIGGMVRINIDFVNMITNDCNAIIMNNVLK